jgi:hypothetical protein
LAALNPYSSSSTINAGLVVVLPYSTSLYQVNVVTTSTSFYSTIRYSGNCYQASQATSQTGSPFTVSTSTLSDSSYYFDLKLSSSGTVPTMAGALLSTNLNSFSGGFPSTPSCGDGFWTVANIIYVAVGTGVGVCLLCCCVACTFICYKRLKARRLATTYSSPTTNTYSPTTSTYTPTVYTPQPAVQPIRQMNLSNAQQISFDTGDNVRLDPVTGAFTVTPASTMTTQPQNQEPQFDPVTGEFRLV